MTVQELLQKADKVVDATGLSCPMPVVRAKKAIDELSSGQILVVQATDRGSLKDIPAWAKQAGHELMETHEADGTFVYVIRKR
ncbi:MAG: sulfurtransferase TusA family protein [Hydrogenibacillus schlegelii]|uniref:Sulfurtransferase TusA family protein n=1 Tax=Hydrogenibacillus schlegelii TaxID=1484 RepID=A0A947GHQ1_HYDSH|nr:sulfurtransferase TusA family protein [Hydrogenibacillus schlegelii]MBT9283493.1 sulfurtransferase TusA family protein [Hydrogenibacillus schlegelii]